MLSMFIDRERREVHVYSSFICSRSQRMRTLKYYRILLDSLWLACVSGKQRIPLEIMLRARHRRPHDV